MNIYIDGACKGNPGPAGAAAYIENDRVIYSYVGEATNNIAEFQALNLALSFIQQYNIEENCEIFTDSQLVIGLFTLGWKAKGNRELVNKIQNLLNIVQENSNITITKVKGHSGNIGNDKADLFANLAITEQKSGVIYFNEKVVTIDDIIKKAEEVEVERCWLRFRELVNLIKEFKGK